MATETMPHPGHENHLCYLVGKQSLKSNMAEYKLLVRNAKFVCKGCGRTAEKAENLCSPEKL